MTGTVDKISVIKLGKTEEGEKRSGIMNFLL